MSNSNWKLTGMIGAVLMLAVFAPAWAAEAVAEVVLEGTASSSKKSVWRFPSAARSVCRAAA